MADVALTPIKHGGADGTVIRFEPGQAVTGLSETDMKALKDAGAVGDVKALEAQDPRTGEIEALKVRIAQLEAEKAEASAAGTMDIATGASTETTAPVVDTKTGAGVASAPTATTKKG